MKDLNYMFILPNGFKWIGMTLTLTCVALILILRFAVGVHWNPALAHLFFSAILLGLLLFVLAKEKTEDEMIVRARYVSIMHAFVIAVFVAVLVPPFLSFRGVPAMDSQPIILIMLLVYIVNFYMFIIKAKHEKRD